MTPDMKIPVAKLARFAQLVAVSRGGSANPDPDDNGDPNNPFGPFGPGGPVIRGALGAILARRLINEVRQLARFSAASGQKSASGIKMAAQYFDESLADWCGTVPRKFPPIPRRWPWPWPWPDPPIVRELDPIDLITVGFELDRAAEILGEGEFRGLFERGAAQALETGFAQL